MIATRTLSDWERAAPLVAAEPLEWELPLLGCLITDPILRVARGQGGGRLGPGRRGSAAPATEETTPEGAEGHTVGWDVRTLRTCQMRCSTVTTLRTASTYTAGLSSSKLPSEAPLANTRPIARITTRTGRVAIPTLHSTPSASARARV